MKLVYLDFEFNNSNEKNLNLVCAVLTIKDPSGTYTSKFWLHNNPEGKADLKKEIISLHKSGAIFVAFMAVAEARSIASLGINPIKLKWIDLQIEYKMLTNHNNELAYGKQLIKGVERRTSPPKPKWAMNEEERESSNMSKPEHSLAACTYKLLGIKIDTEHKKKMRDLILSKPDKFSVADKKAILEYCESDVLNLPKIFKKTIEHYKKLYPKSHHKILLSQILLRGDYAARTALMERTGYPVRVDWIKRFVEKVPQILKEMSEDINSQFPKAPPFKWNNSRQAYSLDLKTIRSYISNFPQAHSWIRTNTGLLSVSADAFEDKFHYKHDYPRNNFGAQMLRFFKFRKSLNGFLPKSPNAKNQETFLDSVGSDGFCRPYMNIYGSQSSRSQPKATSFIPLKAAWMRSLIQPPKGYFICGIDYSSQEFLISGLVSRDIKMVNAYKSGDPYLYFAKQVGAAPENATKKTHAKIREPFKSTTLGVGYGMQAQSLAAKLTQDTGVEHSVDEATILIQRFYETYSRYHAWTQENISEYQNKRFIQLPCGWTMWGDNSNFRSVNNIPIQGIGASIMRKAVSLAQDRGVNVIFTLHDAIYMMGRTAHHCDLQKIDILWQSMHEAFKFYFTGRAKDHAACIRLEAEMWGPDLKDGIFKTPNSRIVKTQKIHIDERSVREYQQFSKYFIVTKAAKNSGSKDATTRKVKNEDTFRITYQNKEASTQDIAKKLGFKTPQKEIRFKHTKKGWVHATPKDRI